MLPAPLVARLASPVHPADGHSNSGLAPAVPVRGTVLDPTVLTWLFHKVTLTFVQPYQAEVWSALGDPTRRAIVEYLAERPQAVGELAKRLPVSQPAVSQHLKVLKDAGLVSERPAGTRRIYRLNPSGVAALRDQLDAFWARALAGYTEVIDQQEEESS